jgi:anaerobic selenocysteine-containing dehydrogenase
MPTVEFRSTTCNRDCPDVCRIRAELHDGRVVRLRGDPSHPLTGHNLCFRTSRFLATQYAPERLTRPLLRKDGALVPVSPDEALDFIAARLLAIRAESGPAAIFHYRSGGSLGLLKSLTDYFFELFGPVTAKRGDICSGAGDYAQEEDFGEEDSHAIEDLLHAKHILVWGKNVVVSSPHTVPVLEAARARGAELVLIDPVHHKTAHHVDQDHRIRPGGDFALAMAVAQVLFDRGWVDPRARERCDHLDAFEGMCRARSVAAWCAEADVAPALAEDLARRLGPGKPTAILVGWGMGRRINGAGIVRALDALGAISGNLGISGGGVSFYFKRRAAFDTTFLRGKAAAPRSIVEPLLGRELLEARDPPIRAVWVTAGNPVNMLPESDRVAEALASRELLVVADHLLTDTAALATVVLPTRTLLEEDDLLGAYGNHYLSASTPVVAAPGDARSDLEWIQGLAERVGLGAELAGTHRAWKERIAAPRLAPHGVDVDMLERGAVRSPLAKDVLFADGKVPTATGRVNLVHVPPPAPEPHDPAFPLFLLSVSSEKSQSAQWSVAQDGPIPCRVHPDAAAGLADGAEAWLASAIGRIRVRVVHDAAQRLDVALLPKGGHRRAGRAANALIRARLTDAGEGAALYDERVRLEPVEG